MKLQEIHDKIDAMAQTLNTGLLDELKKDIELYGKTVAKNARHKAIGEINDSDHLDDAVGNIMNIQFKDINP